VNSGDSELDKESIPDIDTIVSKGAGLVTGDEKTQIIRLVHYTTQEYLEQQEDWFREAKAYVTEACFTYISFDRFESGRCDSSKKHCNSSHSTAMPRSTGVLMHIEP
jgi:hypothetical protein